VELISGGYIEWTVRVAEIGAHRIAERAVAARHERICAAGRIIAARAIGLARGEIIAVIGAVLAWRTAKPSHTVLVNRPAETQPAPKQAPQTANAGEDVPVRVPPMRKQSRRPVSTKLAANPKLDVFPSPRPLTEEELALARYVRNFPSDAKLVAQAQEASEREVLVKMQALANESTESN